MTTQNLRGQAGQPAKILRLREVVARTGLSKATIRRLELEGAFVNRVRIGVRAVGWREAQVEQWVNDRANVVRP